MNKIFIFIVSVTLLISCKNDQSSTSSEVSQDLSELNTAIINPKDLVIPNACEMLSQEWIKETLGLALTDVTLTEADAGNNNSRSCFFKWEDPATPNAGIFIQIMTNPVYEEFDKWIGQFVNAKLTEGESVLGNDEPYKYKKFESDNMKGAYSYDLKRFYWNLGNNYLFMLAFNMDITESKMVDHAKKMATEINNNFTEKVKQ